MAGVIVVQRLLQVLQSLVDLAVSNSNTCAGLGAATEQRRRCIVGSKNKAAGVR